MLEDLLLALYGFEGDIFAKNSKGEFHVVGTIDGFQPGEVDILNELLMSATNYCKLTEFCDVNEFQPGLQPRISNTAAQEASVDAANRSKATGLYMNAFASGIRQLLGKYLECIVDLESCAVRNEQATFVRVRSTLEPFSVAMTVVRGIVAKVERDGSLGGSHLRGVQILDAVYRDLDALRTAGDESIRRAAHSLIEPALRTFAFQTVSWLLRGSLFDPYGEHFVELDSDQQATSDASADPKRRADDEGEPGRANADVQAESENEFEYEYDDYDCDTPSNRGRHAAAARSAGRASPARFRLRVSMCPSFFPTSLAEKIVAVGQLRALLTSLRRRAAGDDGLLALPSASATRDARSQLGSALFEEPFFTFSESTARSGADETIETLFRQLAHELNRLFTLRSADDTDSYAHRFDAAAIERCVDELRDAFAGEFYDEAVANDSRLLSEVAALRRFFLLADGSFFQTFVESLEHAGVVFRSPVDGCKDHVLAGHVRRAFRTALADANTAPGVRESEAEDLESTARRFEIVLLNESSAPEFTDGNDTLFDRLRVRYDRDASRLPFGAFVLHDAAIERLERAFRFMLKVRYARSLLNGALCVDLNRLLTRSRTALRRDAAPDPHSDAAFFANLVRVRHELGAVFNELNYYLLVDSADAEYGTLVRTLRADAGADARRTDLDTLRFAFDTFTLQLAARTFFFSRALQACFSRLFAVAFSFARLVAELLSYAPSTITPLRRAITRDITPIRNQFAELEREFRAAVGTLLRTVSSGASVQTAAFVGTVPSRTTTNDPVSASLPIDSRLIPAATGTLNQALAQFLLRLDFNAHFTRAYLPR